VGFIKLESIYSTNVPYKSHTGKYRGINQFKIRLGKLSHCVGRVPRLVASGVPTAGNPPTELSAKFKIQNKCLKP